MMPAETQASTLTFARRSLSEQVESYLRAEIVNGRLAPGERLVELEIAKQMGTSQAPVREALQRLEREGLVERQSHSGSYVAPISWDEMYEIFCVRTVVERLAVRRVAVSISAEQCDELQALIDDMRMAGSVDDMSSLIDYDMQFHYLICEWAGNQALLRAWSPLYSQLQRLLMVTHPAFFPDPTVIADTHLPIVEALRNNDPEAAEKAIREHIMMMWTDLRAELDALIVRNSALCDLE